MDRRTLAQALDESMQSGRSQLLDSGQYSRGQNLLKTYLIEANVAEPIDSAPVLNRFFSENAKQLAVSVGATDDPSLYQLGIGRKERSFFLDTLDERFWILHTVVNAAEADQAIRRLILSTKNLDRYWLPSHQLEDWAGQLGLPSSLTTRFSEPAYSGQPVGVDDGLDDTSLSLQIGSTSDARVQLARYREFPPLESQLALWSATLTRRRIGDDAFATSTVTASGKVTARGESFRMHEEIVEGIRSRYASLITDWEDRFQLHWTDKEGRAIPRGEPALFLFPEVLTPDATSLFVEHLINCLEPFRLMGVPVGDQETNRYVVKAIDLHTHHKIDLEVTPRFLRVYLHRNSCANVIARLLTNLQHSVDARILLHE